MSSPTLIDPIAEHFPAIRAASLVWQNDQLSLYAADGGAIGCFLVVQDSQFSKANDKKFRKLVADILKIDADVGEQISVLVIDQGNPQRIENAKDWDNGQLQCAEFLWTAPAILQQLCLAGLVRTEEIRNVSENAGIGQSILPFALSRNPGRD